MDIKRIADNSVDILRKNSPKILLFGGIGLGVLAVAGSGAASFKASEIIMDIRRDPEICNDRKKIAMAYAKRIVPLYIPVAILEAGSVICLVKSYDINAKRLAAATALAEVSMETVRLYRDKARVLLGDKKAREIDEEVKKEKDEVKSQLESHGDPECQIQWFKDELTGQEFLCTKEHIKDAALDLNLKLHSEMYVSVNEWIDILNDQALKCNEEYPLTHILSGNETGWEEGYPVYVTYNKTGKTKGGFSCFILEYNLPPRPNYRRRY